MKKILVGLIALTTLSPSAMANFYTGNQLYEWGNALERYRDNRQRGNDNADANMYYGYLSGIYDATNGVIFCPKAGTSIAQISDVVLKYLRDNPEIRNQYASDLVMDAFALSFPCSKKAK
ncbi:Rap1a/Tai family immunity protein [Yersinia proxima]|uniref:Rap1a/Tai family immunity protein n=1 Tax=Yersinia proxima TaxID=2890316 RepID=UPI003D689380